MSVLPDRSIGISVLLIVVEGINVASVVAEFVYHTVFHPF